MEYWNLTRDLSIYIYGAAQLGREIYNDLTEAGYSVNALVDIRYEQLQDCFPVSVISPDDNKIKINVENSAIIVALQNGMIHESIAETYVAAGVSKIVFCPLGKLLSIERKHQMRFAYYEIVTARNFSVKIPSIQVSTAMQDIKDESVINDFYSNAVSFYMDVNSLHITSEENRYSRNKQTNNSRRSLLAGKKAIEFDEYRELFSHLRAGDANVENTKEYLLFSGRENKDEQISLLEDRKRLYKIYEEAKKSDPAFFIDSPIECSIQNGKVCIIDGYHRFFYLLVNGYSRIPVIMSKQDYLQLRGQ